MKAVVLLSGGLDSATVLAVAKYEGFEPLPISFDYGQRHAVELDCARKLASGLTHMVVELDLRVFGGSALTDDIEVPKHDSADELDGMAVPPTYVPARNTIMLAYATAFAELAEADHIFIGVNALDYSGYPDCRLVFIAAFERMANLATVRATNGHHLRIHAPLIDLTKGEIIARGVGLGVDYSMTHSCYDPQLGPASSTPSLACGHCDSCLLRLKGFAENGIEDPVEYA
jgi:7-cyano-7-deazaguanine synthase